MYNISNTPCHQDPTNVNQYVSPTLVPPNTQGLSNDVNNCSYNNDSWVDSNVLTSMNIQSQQFYQQQNYQQQQQSYQQRRNQQKSRSVQHQQAQQSTINFTPEINEWFASNNISVYGEGVPEPIMTFKQLKVPEPILSAFACEGYAAPTAIQSVAWPSLLQSRDFVGIAKTGSGKTMAFMLPAVMHILGQPPLRLGDGPIALVLAPTRELAMQIEEEGKKVMRRMVGVRSACIYGGAPKYEQVRVLRAGAHVVIATPGRLIDMLGIKVTNLLRVTFLVLDEADRMLDMGFEPQIRQICSQVRTDRQTIMFSATWPQEIRDIAASFLKQYIRINVGSEDLLANADVQQHFFILSDQEKMAKLIQIFQNIKMQRILIFTRMKRTADALHSNLQQIGVSALVLHGDKDQNHRNLTLDHFRRNPHACLVATDVAARGLDIKDLDIVINFDFPTNIEDYVHRIGRTGRAGKKGDAFTFLTTNEPSKTVRDLCALLQRTGQAVPQELTNLAWSGLPSFSGRQNSYNSNKRGGFNSFNTNRYNGTMNNNTENTRLSRGMGRGRGRGRGGNFNHQNFQNNTHDGSYPSPAMIGAPPGYENNNKGSFSLNGFVPRGKGDGNNSTTKPKVETFSLLPNNINQ